MLISSDRGLTRSCLDRIGLPIIILVLL